MALVVVRSISSISHTSLGLAGILARTRGCRRRCWSAPDLGHTADVAEAVAFRIRTLPQKFDLDSDAACCRTNCLRGQKPVISSRRGPEDLPNLALLPVITSDQTYGGNIAGLDSFKSAIRKIHHDKSMCAQSARSRIF